jgi:DNA-binding MarR family transcriptional regulator
MQFDELFIQINEILHQSIQKYKEEIIGSGTYSDITLSQLFYIEAIHTLGDSSVSELAKRLKISNASASVGVQKLLKKGLVAKVRSGNDKRVYNISLTQTGNKLIEAELKAFSDFIANIKNTLSDTEIMTVEAIFRKILDRYK